MHKGKEQSQYEDYLDTPNHCPGSSQELRLMLRVPPKCGAQAAPLPCSPASSDGAMADHAGDRLFNRATTSGHRIHQ